MCRKESNQDYNPPFYRIRKRYESAGSAKTNPCKADIGGKIGTKNRSLLASNIEIWNKKQANVHPQAIEYMAKNKILRGLQIKEGHKNKRTSGTPHEVKCEGCTLGKRSRLSFPRSKSKRKHALELVHSEVLGPFDGSSMGGDQDAS